MNRQAPGQRDSAIEIGLVSLQSPEAQHCLDLYFAELALRFEHGFDSAQAGAYADPEMAPPFGAFVVARLDGTPVGCGGFKPLDKHIAEIKRVWCDPKARGTGVATALMDRLEDLARGAGYRGLRLDTNRSLNEAQAMYSRRGYSVIDRYNDNPYADHWFEKIL